MNYYIIFTGLLFTVAILRIWYLVRWRCLIWMQSQSFSPWDVIGLVQVGVFFWWLGLAFGLRSIGLDITTSQCWQWCIACLVPIVVNGVRHGMRMSYDPYYAYPAH